MSQTPEKACLMFLKKGVESCYQRLCKNYIFNTFVKNSEPNEHIKEDFCSNFWRFVIDPDLDSQRSETSGFRSVFGSCV
jgi:hypothetical protein